MNIAKRSVSNNPNQVQVKYLMNSVIFGTTGMIHYSIKVYVISLVYINRDR